MLPGRVTAAAVLMALACARAPAQRRAALICHAPSTVSWLPDSSAALCLPAGFVARAPRRFARPRGDTLPEHWIAISVQRSPALRKGERWPLTLASGAGCLADCTTAEAIIASHDTVAGVPAYIERGLVSGGISGERRLPALIASLDGRPAWTAVVQTYTPDPLLRDSLAAALRTLHIYPGASGDR